MRVERKDLREAPLDVEVNCSPASLELEDPDYRFEEPVQGQVNFKSVGDQVIAKGQIHTHTISQCVRCLSEIRVPVSARVEALYENDPELLKPERMAFGSDEQIITYYDGEAIHPEPELRESLMLELPTRPLCSENCKGLCPNCGANLNDGPCGCGDKSKGGSPWKAAIKNLKLE
ncbi:MAG: YceD family protein [Candidatus Sumerlaeaceae bacterium]